jgi:hypothetical protein
MLEKIAWTQGQSQMGIQSRLSDIGHEAMLRACLAVNATHFAPKPTGLNSVAEQMYRAAGDAPVSASSRSKEQKTETWSTEKVTEICN